MTRMLCLSASYLRGRYHGQEWPPSPAKLFQALMAGGLSGCRQLTWTTANEQALQWLEAQPAPEIIVPPARTGSVYRLFVPNNDTDLLAHDWAREEPLQKTPEALRTGKTVRPWVIEGEKQGEAAVHYLWPLAEGDWSESSPHVETLCRMARMILALGWGIDQVIGSGRVMGEQEVGALSGMHYVPASDEAAGVVPLRVPVPGFYDELREAFQEFRHRISRDGLDTSTVATGYGLTSYRPALAVEPRHFAAFELRDERSRFRSVRWQDMMLVAAWLRHATGEYLKQIEGSPQDWIDGYVLGHGTSGARGQRLSYVPLPTIGHPHYGVSNAVVRHCRLCEHAPPPKKGPAASYSRISEWRLLRRRSPWSQRHHSNHTAPSSRPSVPVS